MRSDNKFLGAMVLLCGAWGCGGSGCIPGQNAQTIDCGGSRGNAQSSDGGHAQCSNLPDFGLTCEEDFFQAGASDIIWVVDNSGSMTDEIDGVQHNIAQFSQVMGESGVDFHLVMVSRQNGGSNSVCVPEPLAGPGCGLSDRFMPIDAFVDSTDGPQVLHDEFSIGARHVAFQNFLRPGSKRTIVFVTDDDSDQSASEVLNTLNNDFGEVVVHGVIGTNRDQCPDLATVGSEYVTLANRTGGLIMPICCSDYGQLVNALASDIAAQNGRYVLEREATPGSVHVFFIEQNDGGGTTRRPITTGWSYDPTLRAVQFEAAARPTAGQEVVIRYSTH